MVRGYMIINAACIAIPAAIYIASIHVDYPDRLALIWIAIVLGQSSFVNFGLGTVLLIRRRLAHSTIPCSCQAVGRIKAHIMGSQAFQMVRFLSR